MFHYVYHITNTVNGKFYVGKRSSRVPPEDDNYWSSSKVVKAAIKKYGKCNFTKTVVAVLDSSDDAYELEGCIVDAAFVGNGRTYNLVGGGFGPSCQSESNRAAIVTRMKELKVNVGDKNPMYGVAPHNKGVPMTDEQKAKISKAAFGRPSSRKGVPMSEEQKAKLSAAKKASVKAGLWVSPTQGVGHTAEAKAKMSASRRGKKQSPEQVANRIAKVKATWTAKREAAKSESASYQHEQNLHPNPTQSVSSSR